MNRGYKAFGPAGQITNGGNGAAAVGGIEAPDRFNLVTVAGSSGRLWVTYVTAEVTSTIGRLMIASGDTASVTPTLARMALFTVAADGSITLVARTASDTAVGAGTFTAYERDFATAGGYPATYPIVRGQRYALGFLMLAGTPASLQGKSVLDGAAPPVASRIIAGQTDIATSYAVGTLSAHFQQLYVRGLPPSS